MSEVEVYKLIGPIDAEDFLYKAVLNHYIFSRVTKGEDLERLTRHLGSNVLTPAFVGEYRVLDEIPGDFGKYLLVRSDVLAAANARVAATYKEKADNVRQWYEDVKDKPFYLGLLYYGGCDNVPVERGNNNFTRDFLAELTCPCHEEDRYGEDRPACGHSVDFNFLGEFIVRLAGVRFDEVQHSGRFSIKASVIAARGPQEGELEQQHPKGTTIHLVSDILNGLRSPECYINDGGVLNCGGCYLSLFCGLDEARAAAPLHVGVLSDSLQALSLD